MSRSRSFGGLPPFHRGTFGLFVAAALCTALLADRPLAEALILHPALLWRGEGLWQPVTANFLFPEGHAGGLLFTLAVQWFLGGAVESAWGTGRYLLVVLGCGVGAYLVPVALAPLIPEVGAVAVGGMTPIDLVAVTAFGVMFGRQPLRLFGALPLSARGIAMLAVGVSVVGPLLRGAPWPEVLPLVAAVIWSLLFLLRPWRKMRRIGRRRSRRPKRDHLQVVRPSRNLPN